MFARGNINPRRWSSRKCRRLMRWYYVVITAHRIRDILHSKNCYCDNTYIGDLDFKIFQLVYFHWQRFGCIVIVLVTIYRSLGLHRS